MDTIMQYIKDLGIDFYDMLILGGILLSGLLIYLLLGRFIFGKQSGTHCVVSSAITIVFTYLAVIGLYYAGPKYAAFIAPMPYAEITKDVLYLYPLFQGHYTELCSQVLRMIILAFLVNIIDRWMPQKRNIFAWIFFRMITIATSLLFHLTACALWNTYLPADITVYAPVILLALLILLLLTGALKLLVGILLSSVNPIIAALYTFFFATIVGKLLTRAIATTGLLTIIVYILQQIGVARIPVSPSALLIYLPYLAILAGFWYLIHHKRK